MSSIQNIKMYNARERKIASLLKQLQNLSMYSKSNQNSMEKQLRYSLEELYKAKAKEQKKINNAKNTRQRAGPELYQGGYRKRKTQKRKSRKQRK